MATSNEAFLPARLTLDQPSRHEGYRANVDALHLAGFASLKAPASLAVDLGAGAGAVGLSLLASAGAKRVVFVELEPVAASFARRNIDANGFGERGSVIVADVSDSALSARIEGASLIVCNPPYFAPGRGRVPVGAARAMARTGSVSVFLTAARRLASERARVCFVYPAGELATLLEAHRAVGLEPKRLRLVHPSPGKPARIALVESKPGKRGGLEILPPLIEA